MTNQNQPVEPDGVFPPLGPYTHAWIVPGGSDWLYVSGQVAVDTTGQVVGLGDIGAQVEQVFRNLDGVLAGAGFEFADIVKFTTYLVRVEDVQAYRTAREPIFDRYFPDRRFPASTLVVVSQLANPEMLIEIETVAARAR
jgi:enamine deaminase RidA (YjgF/YER057c/UK114 family)